jgi:Domain of unknown function (DUF4136)
MKTIAAVVIGLALTQTPPIGKADSTFDKQANFASFRTYAWTPGSHAFNPAAHQLIVDALEAEMTARGFTKVTTGADVTLSYSSMAIKNVDLKALDQAERAGSAAPTKDLGRLVVVMRTPARQQLWSAATREYLEPDIAKLGATIKTVAARLFETYPKPPA